MIANIKPGSEITKKKGAITMCDLSKKPVEDGHLSRRGFLKGPTAAAAAGLLGGGWATLCGSVAHADALTKEQRDRMTPEEIIAEMKRGNERFRKGEGSRRDYLAEQKASAAGQFPAAVILSCIDSRAPAEIIMDLGIGNVFNTRVAGNIANGDILGSMEFACKVAGAKVVLVMGHTACGAIKGAIDNVELGNLTALLTKIRPAVKATEYDGERSSKNLAFVDAVARKNVELTMAQILEKSPVLGELHSKHAIKVAGAMYDLETAKVEFLA
jgi:carbonic anhydrase